MYLDNIRTSPDELAHHGILGQRKGIRRFQYPDGTLTPAGRRRYLNSDGSLTGKGYEEARRLQKEYAAARNRYNGLTGKRVSTRQATPPNRQTDIKQPPKPDDPRTLTRQQLEDAVNYQRALNNYNQMFIPQQEKKKSIGARIATKMWNEVVEPGITNTAKGVVEAKLKQYASKQFNVNLSSGNKKKKG